MMHASRGSAAAAVPHEFACANTLDQVEARIRTAHRNQMGYLYNLAFRADVPRRFGGYLINNLGDPYAGSHYASEVCELEREVVGWFEELWETDDAPFWGSVGASGTEGNLWGLYLSREALTDAMLLHSDDAHYSIPKSGRILRMETRSVRSLSNGEISVEDLGQTLATLNGRPVVVALTCGTTMTGAHDDIAAVIAAVDGADYGADRETR